MDVQHAEVDIDALSQNSELDETKLQEIESSARPDATVRATAYGVKKFKDWLLKRNRTCEFATVTAEELNELLRKYYAEVKPVKQGGSLSASTLTGLRAAIHRYVTGAPFNRPINIIKDKEFMSANKMFTARCKLYFKNGNRKPQHKPPIGDGDMKKLGHYFSRWDSNPDVLVESVWFFLCFYFGRRGREGWANMTVDTFRIEQDSEGHDYVILKTTEVTKNHQGGHKQTDMDYGNQRMYGPGVEIFRFYLSKLHPENKRLFQSPLRVFKSDGKWFKNEPMGKNTLSSMMPRISTKASLSMSYTCHSVRASTITILYQAGVSTQSIIVVTKHKSSASLGHYLQDISNEQKREVSTILTSALSDTGSINKDLHYNDVLPKPAGAAGPVSFSDNESETMFNFDLGFDIADMTEEKTCQKDAPSTSGAYVNSDNAVAPAVDVPVKVYNLTIPPNQLQESTSANGASSTSILTHATFHGCTINFQLKQV